MSKTGHFRIHGRHEVDLSAVVEQDDHPDDRHAAGDSSHEGPSGGGPRSRIVNLSLGGACVEVAVPLSTGAALTLEILAPTLWDPLVLRGRVVWSRADRGAPLRAGLCFEPTSPSRAFALFELLGAHRYDA